MTTTTTTTTGISDDGATNTPAPGSLLAALSSTPPLTCRSHRIDFASAGLVENTNDFALLIDNLLSPEECSALVSAAEASAPNNTWATALVNVGGGLQQLRPEVRLCDRILWDEPAVADQLLARIMPHLPAEIATLANAPAIMGWSPVRRKEAWALTRLNERLRFLRYTPGMYFREHCDGSYVTPDGSEISFLTVHLYLNGGRGGDEGKKKEEEELKGGATRFIGWDGQAGEVHLDVNPTAGSCLVFQHRNLWHSGEEVVAGTKYTLRTDVMYRRIENESAQERW